VLVLHNHDSALHSFGSASKVTVAPPSTGLLQLKVPECLGPLFALRLSILPLLRGKRNGTAFPWQRGKNGNAVLFQAEQRVKALKIAIQCAKLLADTKVIQFYPSKFVLISDILDTFGKLVAERIYTKSA
jgi:hypothetical protein